MNHDNKLSFAEKLGYGMGMQPAVSFTSSVTMFLTWFYTDIYGLSAAAVGVMFLVTRVSGCDYRSANRHCCRPCKDPLGPFSPVAYLVCRTLCRAGGNDLHDSGIWRIE